jgi:hypothetical protein
MSDDDKKTPKSDAEKKPAKSVKSRASNHHPDEEPTFNTVLESEEREKKTAKTKSKAKTGISRPSAILLSLLAALAGGTIGWSGPILFGGQGAKNDALQASLEQTRSELATAKSEQTKLADTLAAIQGTSRNQASSNQSLAQTLGDLEDRITALQEAEQPVDNSEAVKALEDRLSKLATLTDIETEDGTTSVNVLALVERLEVLEAGTAPDLAARLDALETQIQENANQTVAFPKPDTTPIELPPAETEASAQDMLDVLIDTFPRTIMLETVSAQKALAAKKPSWLQRTLSRHIKTHDDQMTDPVDTINAAEAALKRGEVNGALNLMGELNPPVRAVAADWMGAAKKAAKRIEKDL